jgi:hypothetical protein
VSIHLYGIEDCTFDEVRDRTYKKRAHKDLDLKDAKDLLGLVAAAKECYKAAQERRAVITDKCKTLQTFNAFLLALVGLFLTKAFDFDSCCMRVVFSVAVALVAATVVLLLLYFAVGAEAAMDMEQEMVTMGDDDSKKSSINSYRFCTVTTDNKTDFLADLYRVASSLFLVALTLIVALFLLSYLFGTGVGHPDKTIDQLRNSSKVVDMLRGPKGDKGDPASVDKTIEQLLSDPRLMSLLRGPKGDKGDSVSVDEMIDRLRGDLNLTTLLRGPKGDKGDPPSVDLIIQRLRSDPELIDLLRGHKEDKGDKGDPTSWAGGTATKVPPATGRVPVGKP